MNRIAPFVIIVAALLAPASPASADWWPGPRASVKDWPQHFRGSYHQASALVDPGIGVDDVGRLAVEWSVNNPKPRGDATPQVSTSPIVIGDAVYVAEYNRARGSVTRHDRGNGDIVWRKAPLGNTYSHVSGLAYGHGIVVVTHGYIVSSRARSIISAFDAADGRLLWRKRLRGGSISAPTVRGNTVYVFNSRSDGSVGEVVAIHLRGGAYRWRQDTPGDVWSRASPSTDGTLVYVPVGFGRVVALDALSGALVWDQQLVDRLDGYQMTNAPLGDGRLFVSSGDTLRALDVTTGAVLWERQMADLAGRITLGRFVYVVLYGEGDGGTLNGPDRLVALDPATGADVWTHIQNRPVLPDDVSVGPVTSAGGVVYVPVRNQWGGRLLMLDEMSGEPSGSINSFRQAGVWGGPLGAPAVAYGHVYLSVEDQVVSLVPVD